MGNNEKTAHNENLKALFCACDSKTVVQYLLKGLIPWNDASIGNTREAALDQYRMKFARVSENQAALVLPVRPIMIDDDVCYKIVAPDNVNEWFRQLSLYGFECQTTIRTYVKK